ncbi:MAG: tetratricopeptide repeat protein [Flavobacteriales bacterium]|nr:tetratricopeptide repeat protein [Flavobacteriales bacterium]
MKFFLVVLIFFSLIGYGQTDWISAYNLAEEFYSGDDSELSIKYGEKALELAVVEFGKESLEYGLTQQLMGMIYFSSKRNDKAIYYFNESIKSFETIGEETNKGVSKYLIGSLFVSQKDFEKAEEQLLSAGEIFENETTEDNSYYYGLVLEELVEVYTSYGQTEVVYDLLNGLIDHQIKIGTVRNPDLASSYNKLALVNIKMERYNRSEENAYKAISVCEKNGLEGSLEYEKAMGILGINYVRNGNANLGESLVLACKSYYQKLGLEKDPFYYKLLLALGRSNYYMEYFGESYKYLLYAKELYPKYDWLVEDYSENLELLFNTLLKTGNYEEASAYMGELKKANQQSKFMEDIALINLEGVLAYKRGELKKAEEILSRTIILTNDKISLEQLEYLNNYANVLCDLGKFDDAEKYYLQVIEILEKSNTNSIENYIGALNNLALLYLDRGDYSKAELLLSECVNMSKRVFGAASNEYALALNNLGAMYYEIGNYDIAVDNFLNASDLYAQNFGKESVEYTSLENNIALLFSTVGDHEEALIRLNNVLSVESKILGENNLNHAQNLLSIAREYYDIGNMIKADQYAQQSSKLVKKLVGEDHIDFAHSQNLIGMIKFRSGDLENSNVCFSQAANVYKDLFGEMNIDYARSLLKLASVEAQQNKIGDAVEMFEKAKQILNSNMEDVFAFLSEQEKEKYLQTLYNDFNDYFKYTLNMAGEQASLGGAIFEQSVKLKGLLLKSSSVMRNTILNGSDEELKDMYNSWVSVKKRIADLYATQGNIQSKKLTELETEANNLEKELYLRTNLSGTLKDVEADNWQQIQKKLNPQDVVLEFISYLDESTNVVEYAVTVLDDKVEYPKVIKLFSETDIMEILGEYGANNYAYVTKIYGDNKNHETALYDLIWKPLEEEVKSKKNIYISPTGILHRISLWALGATSDQLMIDMYNIQNLSTSLNLLDPVNVFKEDIKNVSLFGDISYNTPQTEEEHWNYLEGTAAEIEGVEKSFKSKQYSTMVVRGLDASETSFKENAGHSNLIHVATHGFFFPDPEKLIASVEEEVVEDVGFRGSSNIVGLSSFTHNKNPLMRSGLIFAGVNDLWNHERFVKKDDGVLTAYEVTQMDFTDTKLVVLSACETGLGEIEGNEGVYGLQRALKMHGIPYIVNSLWQVPDKETQEFMNYFYNELLTKQIDVKEAFSNARMAMRAKYSPYYWAAFVLIQ